MIEGYTISGDRYRVTKQDDGGLAQLEIYDKYARRWRVVVKDMQLTEANQQLLAKQKEGGA